MDTNAEFEQTKRDMQKVSDFNKMLLQQSDAIYQKNVSNPQCNQAFSRRQSSNFVTIDPLYQIIRHAAGNQIASYHKEKRQAQDLSCVVAAVGLEPTDTPDYTLSKVLIYHGYSTFVAYGSRTKPKAYMSIGVTGFHINFCA